MSAMAETSWSEEPVLSGWLIAACLSVSAFILFSAGLLQQSSKVTHIFSQASQPALVVAEMIEPRQAIRTDPTNNSMALPDGERFGVHNEEISDIEAAQVLIEPIEEIASAQVLIDPFEEAASAQILIEPIDEAASAQVLIDPIGEAASAQVLIDPIEEAASAQELKEPIEKIEPALVFNEVVDQIEAAQVLIEPTEGIESVQADVDLELSDVQSDADFLVAIPSTNGFVDTNPILDRNDVDEGLASSTQPESPEVSLASLRKTVLEGMNQRSKRVKFSPGQVGLARGSEALLAIIFEDLFLYSESDIVIEVASQDANADATNENLSLERGAAIKTYLVDRGLAPRRLFVSVLPVSVLGAEPQLVNIEASLDE